MATPQDLLDVSACFGCLNDRQLLSVQTYLLELISQSSGGSGPHDLLSATHPDTVPGSPSRGSLIVGNSTPKWQEFPIGAANRVLRSDGVDVSWSQLVLTTDVTGILPIANGGTNSSAALNNNRIMVSSGGAIVEAAALINGQLLIGSTGASPVAASLTAGANISITPGAGSITIAVTGVVTQAYSTIQEEGVALPQQSTLNFISAALTAADDPGNSRTNVTLTHSALTKVDDTNVTLTLGGSPATALLAATSLTLGWTGTLSPARGGTGTGTAFTQGSVIFAGAAGAYTQDNANFFFDNTNNRLGIITSSPSYSLHVLGPGSFQYGFAAGALIIGADLNATTISVNSRKIGRITMASYDGGATNTFLFGGDFQAGGNDIYFGGVTAGSQYAATGIHFFTGATQTTTGGTERLTIDNAGNVGIGIAIPLATLHIVPLTAPALLISPFGAAAGNTGEVRYRELTANGTNYTGFKAADAMAASEIYVLPNAAPAANRFLQAAAVAGGVSALSWAQVSLTADVTGILPVANGGTGTGTAFTQGSVIFAGPVGVYAQDNASLFFNDTTNRLGVGTASPVETFSVNGRTMIGNVDVGGFFGVFRNTTGVLAIIQHNNAANGDVGLRIVTGTAVVGSYEAFTTTINTSGRLFFRAQQSGAGDCIFDARTLSTGDCQSTYAINGGQEWSVGLDNSDSDKFKISGNISLGAADRLIIQTTGEVGVNTNAPTAQFMVTSSTAAMVATIIKAAAAQTANLTEWQSSAGAVMSCVDETGRFGIGVDPPLFPFHVVSTVSNFLTLQRSSAVFASFTNGYNPDTTDGNGVAFNFSSDTTGAGATVNKGFARFGAIFVTHNDATRAGKLTFQVTNNGGALFEALVVFPDGNIGIGQATPTAYLHLKAGTTAAGTAPIKLASGTSMTTAEAGAMEYTTDDLFFTIATGAARKRMLMADAVGGLTSGKIPIATTNGRLIDLTASAAYTPTNVTTDRSYDADTVVISELADVVGTMIADLQAKGILG